jgi:hypothetical protein
MIAVFWRELRELTPATLALVLCAAIAVYENLGPVPDLGDALGTAGCLGAGMGLMQGLLDRWRRGDSFLHHRPLSRLRIHVVRSLAGFTACMVVFASIMLAHGIYAPGWAVSSVFAPRARPLPRLDAHVAVVAAVTISASWALVRFTAAASSWWRAALSLPVLSLAALLAVTRSATIFGFIATILALALAAAAAQTLHLSGRARHARALLLLGFIGLVLGEGLHLTRLGTSDLVFREYPMCGFDERGTLTFWRSDERCDADREPLEVGDVMGDTQSLVAIRPIGGPRDDFIRLSLEPMAEGTKTFWGWTFNSRLTRVRLRDDEIVVDRPERPTTRMPWDAGLERVLRVERVRDWTRYDRGYSLVVSSQVLPVSTTSGIYRFRIFPPDGAPTVEDQAMEPVTSAEKSLVALCGLVTLPRPAVLNLAAYISGPPWDWPDALRWWFRDPYYAERSHAGWLASSLLVGLVCALFVRRSARARCGTIGAVRAWTAVVFLLGPLGLLWFRLVVCRHAVLPVGGARRAVNLNRSPATDAPWPEPAGDGTEVLA